MINKIRRYIKATKQRYYYDRSLMAIINRPDSHGKRLHISQIKLDIAGLICSPCFALYMLVMSLCGTSRTVIGLVLTSIGVIFTYLFSINLKTDYNLDSKVKRLSLGVINMNQQQEIQMLKEDHQLVMQMAKILAKSYSGPAEFRDWAQPERKRLAELVKVYQNK